MNLYLSSKVTGIGQDILRTGDVLTLGTGIDLPDDAWHLEDRAYRSVLRVSSALGIDLKIHPEDARLAWWKNYVHVPRIDHVVGKKKAINHVKSLIMRIDEILDMSSYFVDVFQDQNRLLDTIKPAFADLDAVESLSLNVSVPSTSAKEGVCKVACYDNFSSSTGRMSVSSGVKILTLNRAHRQVFRSRWGDEGCLMGIDYMSLEPRVLLFLTGQHVVGEDVYTHIANNADVMYERDTIKLMILSILYGMSRRNFIVKFIDSKDPDVSYDRIHAVLGTKRILDRIKANLDEGKFQNYFGRPLKCDENLMINYYTQSTAVDVACGGFLNLVEKLAGVVDPIFLIHDELVVDVKKKHVSMLEDACKSGLYIPRLNVSFPVKVKVFNGREDH